MDVVLLPTAVKTSWSLLMMLTTSVPSPVGPEPAMMTRKEKQVKERKHESWSSAGCHCGGHKGDKALNSVSPQANRQSAALAAADIFGMHISGGPNQFEPPEFFMRRSVRLLLVL
jgi:hypothetical protein